MKAYIHAYLDMSDEATVPEQAVDARRLPAPPQQHLDGVTFPELCGQALAVPLPPAGSAAARMPPAARGGTLLLHRHPCLPKPP